MYVLYSIWMCNVFENGKNTLCLWQTIQTKWFSLIRKIFNKHKTHVITIFSWKKQKRKIKSIRKANNDFEIENDVANVKAVKWEEITLNGSNGWLFQIFVPFILLFPFFPSLIFILFYFLFSFYCYCCFVFDAVSEHILTHSVSILCEFTQYTHSIVNSKHQ